MSREPLVSRYADDPEMAELVERFSAALPERVEAIVAALRAGDDREGARRLVHQLKGSAGGYGFPEISTAAARLEEALSAGEDARAGEASEALVALCDRVKR